MLTPALRNPHTHVREGSVVEPLVHLAIAGGARALGPMPNTSKGLMTAAQVDDYITTMRSFVPANVDMEFIPIVQITEQTTRKDIDECVSSGIKDAKIYPKGRTTESHNGVAHYGRILDIVRYAGDCGMRIHFHPEHPSNIYDNRDAEFAFLPIVDIFLHETSAIIVWEHGTDSRCIPHWEEWAKTGRFYLTLTAHHLVENESGTYGDVGAACKPPYKKETDRRGLVGLVGKNYMWVMAGGDDAPHSVETKHRLGPCTCGAYTAPFLLPLYAHALHDLNLHGDDRVTFAEFTSGNAQRLYGLSHEPHMLTLVERPFKIPSSYQVGPWTVEPFWAEREIRYTLLPST